MKSCLKYYWILVFIAIPILSFAQPRVVDGFDYPFGNRGINVGGEKVPYLEKIFRGAYNDEINLLYPFNPYQNPERWDNTNYSDWYNHQDVGNYYNYLGGLHSGEDWNFSSETEDEAGQEIYAIANGEILTVNSVYYNAPMKGAYYIVIEHSFENSNAKAYSIYAHITDKKNDNGEISKPIFTSNFVQKGQIIGRLAKDMIELPTHLHFEIRIDKTFSKNEYCWTNSAGWYYTDERNKQRKSGISKDQVEKAFSLMQKDGVIDPSDFIDSHREEEGVGYFSKNNWQANGISLAFLNCYNKNGGIYEIGHPYDNNEGGLFVHPLTIDINGNSTLVYLQDFIQGDFTSTICYNPALKKAFHLKGCIGYLWWQNVSNGLRYQNYLGIPVSDELPSDESGYTTMQSFQNGTIHWRPDCKDGKDNVKINFDLLNFEDDCVTCFPKVNLSVCDCENSVSTKSASLLPDCEALFTAEYTKKTSWDFGKEETLGWSARNANDMNYHEDWYWMIDPVQDPDPVSGSGIVSPPFLNSVNTSAFDKIEVRAACKSQFMETLQLHLLINGKWQFPLLLKCVSPNEEQLPNNQCIYRADILHPGQIQQFRIDFIEGSDVVDDRIFIDYVHFLEGENPVPTLKAGFSSDVQFGKYPLTVSFADSSIFKDVSTEVQYVWNFGDGSTSFESSPIHVYSSPGEYTVSLKISSGIFNDSINKNGFVKVYDSSPVTNMEYFFDSDPGKGNGNPVVITPGEDFTQSFYIDYNDLTEGYHKLYVRAKDAAGKWGFVSSKDFYAVHLSNIPYVVQMEYFFDTDPGFGSGKSIPVNDYFYNANEQNIILDFDGLDEGYHTLFVRVKDNQGNWGLYAKTPFYRITESNQFNLVEIEYFIDVDPGIGKAIGIGLQPAIYLEHNIFLDLALLTEGEHIIGARVKNLNHVWSETYIQSFNYNTTYSPLYIENSLVRFKIFPNPATERVTFEWHDNPVELYLEIFNISGQKVLNKKIYNNTPENIKKLNEGIYFYRLSDRGEIVFIGKLRIN
jgi:PKD repeat protein/murein DD-endopeptidase MepM/ murein hydrolase activator NlpD